MKPNPIARSRLKAGEWYKGDGITGHVAFWDGEFFIGIIAIIPFRRELMGYDTANGFTPYELIK